MKPLIRWIIGPVKKQGFECLKDSINYFSKLYTNFDLMICHNQLNQKQLELIKSFGICTYEQKYTYGIEPKGVAWKLCPPRLRIKSHEIIIDNDIIIKNKIPQINEFLSTESTLLYQAGKPMYGNFEKFVPNSPYINSGIYGMPPGFDLNKKMNFYLNNLNQKEWKNSCNQGRYTWDEQGIVAACLLNHPNHLLITLEQIANCEIDLDDSKMGMHFVGLNRYTKQKPWKEWKIKKLKVFA